MTHRFLSHNNSSVTEEEPSRLHRIRSSSTTTISINNEIKSSRRRKSTSNTDLINHSNEIKSNNSEILHLDKVN